MFTPRVPRFLILAVLVSACGATPVDSPLTVAPATATLWPGQALQLRATGPGELRWADEHGRLLGSGPQLRFVAPSQAGTYAITVAAGGEQAEAHLTVPDFGEASTTATTSGTEIRALRGRVALFAEPQGTAGARARFTLEGGLAAGPTVEVEIQDRTHGVLRIDGVPIDGRGTLSDAQTQALEEFAGSELGQAVALLPLDLGCLGLSIDPPVWAAVLMPWQTVLKYLSADRLAQNRAFAQASSCHYLSDPEDLLSDGRPHAQYPLLANGQAVPLAFDYFPFDTEGALPISTAQGLSAADQDVFGPGESMCRGACGADCEENNCGQPHEEWRCVQDNNRNTGEKQLWLRYTCGEHPGCIEHDACFDNCKFVFGVGSFESGLCMRGCDLQAASGYGPGQGVEWAQGYGPYTHEKSYDYRQGTPIRDEQACPVGVSLTAVPGSGLAPHSAVIRWEGLATSTGPERCRLDFGDGTPVLTIDPCDATGEQAHTYLVPSELRQARGVYTVRLFQVGAQVEATTEVQATWRLNVSPASGTAPLLSQFSWDGFSGVTKTLRCTLDYGDGSAPEAVEDCGHNLTRSHPYADAGTYVATLTVRGEDRPATKFVTVEVREEEPGTECSAIRNITAFAGTARFSYSTAASQGDLSVSLSASGMLSGTLSKYVEGPGGISFISTQPSGTLSFHELAVSSAPFADNPIYETTVSGDPVPPPGSPDEGSNLILSFDLDRCRYNIHVQALGDGTSRSGSQSFASQPWVGVFQSDWRPIPSGNSLSDEGSYPVHSDDYILESTDLSDWYLMSNYDLIDFLGEDGLGQAPLAWQFRPLP